MILFDEVTFSKELTAFCPNCGSGDIKPNDDPFLAMICNKCGWGFTVNINIIG